MRPHPSHSPRRRLGAALATVLATAPLVATAALAATPTAADASVTTPSDTVVIAGVFGGGGDAGSYWANDFVELFNPSATPQSLGGLSLQYASSSGNISSTKTVALDDVTLQPGQYFLFAGNANGSQSSSNVALTPPPDQSDDTYAIANDAATIFLVNGTTTITSPTSTAIVDEVGFGDGSGDGAAAADFLGAPAPTLSKATGIFRNDDGCADTDDNAADFGVVNADTTAPALPVLDTSSTLDPCSSTPPASTPEVPWAPLLPLSAAAVGGVVVWRRRDAFGHRG